MREIKFRVWDKYDNEMKYDAQDTYDYIVNNIMEDCFGDVLKSERYEIMQYTGLKDKNGKEIYEGDIWRYEEIVGSVVFDKGAFSLHTDLGKGAVGCLDIGIFRNACEVIGNIYENPDLLEKYNAI